MVAAVACHFTESKVHGSLWSNKNTQAVAMPKPPCFRVRKMWEKKGLWLEAISHLQSTFHSFSSLNDLQTKMGIYI